MSRTASWAGIAFVGFAIGIMVLGSIFIPYLTAGEVTCTVTDKDRTTDPDGFSDMRIYTEDCGVLKLGDTPVRGVFNSADLYSIITPGQTYDFKTYGIRIPILSMFPTIYEVSE